MNITTEQAQKLLTGSFTTSQLGFSMLLTRLRGLFAKDKSQQTLQNCTSEINAFLGKYASIMVSEYTTITKL